MDLQPDARRADSQVFNQNTDMGGYGDLAPRHSGSTDSGVAPGTSDVARDVKNLPDTGDVALADGARSDGGRGLPDCPHDAVPSNISVSDGRIAPDASLPISIDTMPVDTMPADAMGVDTMLADAMGVDMMGTDKMRADTAISPDLVPIETSPAPDGGTADVQPDAVPNYTVTFSAGKAVGAMSGNGWVSMGIKDTVTSPTCGASAEPITAAAGCAVESTNWDTTNALCLSGVVPALSSSPTPLEYGENWGVKIGVNASEPSGPLGRAFRTVAFNLTGTPTAGLRAVVHIDGASSDLSYCASMSSDAPIPLTSFNTSCWDNTGTFLATEDIPKIDHIDIHVPPTSQKITVTQLCLTSIVLGS